MHRRLPLPSAIRQRAKCGGSQLRSGKVEIATAQRLGRERAHVLAVDEVQEEVGGTVKHDQQVRDVNRWKQIWSNYILYMVTLWSNYRQTFVKVWSNYGRTTYIHTAVGLNSGRILVKL